MGSLHISLDLHNTGVLVAGDSLQGKVIIATSKEYDVENIDVSFIGRAIVDFRTGYGRHTKYYSDKEDFLNNSIILVEGNGVPLKIPAGVKREFEFSFIIPENLPSTTPDYPGSYYGKLDYYATAKMKIVNDENPLVSMRQPFQIQSILDLNNIPSSKSPVIKNLHRELYGIIQIKSKGIVKTTIKLPKSGFALGEAIPLTVEIDNQSKKIVGTSVTLERKIYFIGRQIFTVWDAGGHSKMASTSIATVDGPKIDSRTKINWEVPNLTVNSLPSSKNGETAIIRIQYELTVKIFPKDYKASKFKIPLIIGTIPTTASIPSNDEIDEGTQSQWNTISERDSDCWECCLSTCCTFL